MAEGKDALQVPHSVPVAVPTAFGVEFVLPPNGRRTITFQGDPNFLLRAFAAQADGPAVVELRVGDAPTPGTPVVQIPGGTLMDYLVQELPVHLAALVGEDLEQWREKNRKLYEAARAGDDEAFFELLARDPRQFASELTLGRAVTWRTAVHNYNSFYRMKTSRLFSPTEAIAEARARMTEARKKLARLGKSQLSLYDQRGKRPLPPPMIARGIYYGLLCLLKGLRTLHADRVKAGVRPRQLDRELSRFVAGLETLQGESPFLPHVVRAIRLLRDVEILNRAGLGDLTLSELVGTNDATPSDTARIIAAAALEVSADTIERLAAQPVPLPLLSAGNAQRVLVGPPTYQLLEFPEVEALLARLTR
jgi:hypothetical protein